MGAGVIGCSGIGYSKALGWRDCISSGTSVLCKIK